MVYKACLNGETFFTTKVDDPKYALTKAKVLKELGAAGSFNFTVPKQNKSYGQFHKLSDRVKVYQDEDILFSGRVYAIDESFDTQDNIICEGLLALLNDSVFRPEEFQGSLHALVRRLLECHNDQVEKEKQISAGRFTVSDADVYRDYQNYESTMSRMQDLVSSFGGFLSIREEGTNLYLDWMAECTEGSVQAIEFGQNILDITISEDSEDIATVLIPLGATDENDVRVTIASVNDGKDYIVAEDSYVEKYGYIAKAVIWDDVNMPSILKTKGQNWLSACLTPKITINVTAVDLADAGYEINSFREGQRIKVVSDPHELDDWFDCTKREFDLLNYANNKMSLGEVKIGYIQSQHNAAAGYRNSMEKIVATYATKTMLQLAIENATDWITGNEGGFRVELDTDGDGFIDEVLFMDTPDIKTAVNVWRINQSGWGHSSSGYKGPYKMAATLDNGFVADFITTGILNADLIRAGILRAKTGDSYWNMETGVLHIAGDGKTTINGGAIETGTIKAAQISAGAITAEKIASEAVTTEKLAAGAITAEKIAAGAIEVSNMTDAAKSSIVSEVATKMQYYISTSSSSQRGGTWKDTTDAWSAGKYVWVRVATTKTYESGTSTTSYSTAVYDANLTAALSNASNAKSTADTAKSTADSAKTTAEAASTVAGQAKTTADTAKSTADTAKSTAESAGAEASDAKSTASAAKSTAESAANTADSAASVASAAQSTANANVKSTVSVYYRSTTSTTPTINDETSIGTAVNTSNAWEYVMPRPKKNCYFFTCERYTYADGTTGFSTVRQMANLTYSSLWCSANDATQIDGGTIYTESIKAESIDTEDLFAQNLTATHFNITGGSIDIETDSESIDKIVLKYKGYIAKMSPNHLETANEDKKLKATISSAGHWSSYDDQQKAFIGAMDAGYGRMYLCDTNQDMTVNIDGSTGKITGKALSVGALCTGLFSIKAVTLLSQQSLAGDAYKNGNVTVTPDKGYEFVAIAGYHLTTTDGGQYARYMNVYSLGLTAKTNVYYAICNTGSNTRSVTITAYLIQMKIS